MGKKKKKIYDKIYWRYYKDCDPHTGIWRISVTQKIVIDRVEEEPGRCYKVYFKAKGETTESWICICDDGEGIALGKSRRYTVDRDGKLDIAGISTYLYNRKINEVLEQL